MANNIIGRIQNYFGLEVTNYFDDKTRKTWQDYCANTPGFVFIMDKIPSEEIILPQFMAKLVEFEKNQKPEPKKKFVITGDVVQGGKPVEVADKDEQDLVRAIEQAVEQTVEELPSIDFDAQAIAEDVSELAEDNYPEILEQKLATEDLDENGNILEDGKPVEILPEETESKRDFETKAVVEEVRVKDIGLKEMPESPDIWVPQVAVVEPEHEPSLEELTAGLDAAIENGTVESVVEPVVESEPEVVEQPKAKKKSYYKKKKKTVEIEQF